MNFMRDFRIFRFSCKLFQNTHAPVFNKKLTEFYIQERQYAARKHKRAALLAAKLEKKLAQPEKPKRQLAYQIRKKTTVTADQQQTRYRDENWDTTRPIDNVWRMALYRGKSYTVEEAIEMFREVHDPTVLNRPDAFIYTRVEFDLRTKKKNHYLDSFNGVINFPHTFETGFKNNIIAICRSEDDQLKATEAGAVYSGSSALIKQILSGEIFSEDYDYLICHPDSYKDISVLRGLLKKKFPTAHNGLLRIDIDRAVATFLKGMKYKSDHSIVELDFGWTDICFGRLNMDTKHLEANFSHLLNVLLKHTPTGTAHPFITRTDLWCEKTFEKFKVLPFKYLPGYEEQVEESSKEESAEVKLSEEPFKEESAGANHIK